MSSAADAAGAGTPGAGRAPAPDPAVRRRAAVLGSPIAHSLSPVLHRAAYRRLGLADWRYDAYEVTEAQLPGFVAGLGREWAGLSLTMPLKRAILPLLAETGGTARSVDAVNTVLRRPDGTLRGENTDVPGLVAALAERGVTTARSAAVLGGGATAASALAALSVLVNGPYALGEAPGIGSAARGEVSIYLRSPARAAELQPVAAAHGVDLRVRPWSAAAEALGADLVVNTTPAGAADELADAVPDRVATLFDVLYHPWPTALAAAWAKHDGTILGGQDLLVHQAVLQVDLMTADEVLPGERPDAAALLAAMRAALADLD
ncbi:MAG TPA: shikimate dehydrogenase [Actinocrinis sp.]|nr:shikimate dehydrogenase [Actinocrinis sp.]